MIDVADENGRENTENVAVILPDNDSFGYQTLLLARRLQADFMHAIRHIGLSPAQTNVLAEISRAGALPQRDLAERLDIGNASIGQTIDRLETSGHIVRVRGIADRRTAFATLTPKGKQALEVIADAAWSQIAMLKDRAGADAIDRMTAMMIRLNAALGDAAAVEEVE